MRRLIAAAAMVWTAGAATAQTYDIEAYCAMVADAVGGSYTIEASCRQQEQRAKQTAQTRTIEPRIRRYCAQVGDAVGGSYQIFVSCVDQEERAKAGLQ